MLSPILQVLELFSVAIVILATVYVLQSTLLRAHILLRLGLTLVCAGSVLEFYESIAFMDSNHYHTAAGVIENLGQAVIYGWVALSKRLWERIGAIGE